jgi:hypothetical protein
MDAGKVILDIVVRIRIRTVLQVHLHLFSKIKSHKEVTKQVTFQHKSHLSAYTPSLRLTRIFLVFG